MKAKLLKKLRRRFSIEYQPSSSMYHVIKPGDILSFTKLSNAKGHYGRSILDYARYNYSRYAKKIKIL